MHTSPSGKPRWQLSRKTPRRKHPMLMFATQLAPLRTAAIAPNAPRRNVSAAAAKPGAAEKKVSGCTSARGAATRAPGAHSGAHFSRGAAAWSSRAPQTPAVRAGPGDKQLGRVAAPRLPFASLSDTRPHQDFLSWLNEMMVKDSSQYAGYGAHTLLACTFCSKGPTVSAACLLSAPTPAQRLRWRHQKRGPPACRTAGSRACLDEQQRLTRPTPFWPGQRTS